MEQRKGLPFNLPLTLEEQAIALLVARIPLHQYNIEYAQEVTNVVREVMQEYLAAKERELEQQYGPG